jgi:hypothetical protein
MDNRYAKGLIAEDRRCSESGRLISKDSCYALRRGDGTDIWLEMDQIPLHLVDRKVRIEGELYGRQLIQVELITAA